MSISSATAAERARKAVESFPKGTITVEQAQAMLMSVAFSQEGYASGSAIRSRYGNPSAWPEDAQWGGRQTWWCELWASWCFTTAFGPEAARAGIGRQSTVWERPPAGGTWTVWQLSWLRANDCWVGTPNAETGDLVMQVYGRTGAETDHVGIARGKNSGDWVPTIEGNTSGADPSAGASVARANRHLRNIVGVYRPRWKEIVAVYNAQVIAEGAGDLAEYAEGLAAFGFPATEAGVRGYQEMRSGAPHHLIVDGIFGPKTQAALEADMATLESIVPEIKDHIDRLRRERTNAHVKEMAKMEGIQAAVEAIGAAAGMTPEQVRAIVDDRIESATVVLQAQEDEGV